MINFPTIDPAQRLALLAPPTADKAVRVVLDTDTFNEIDDQFALVYALLSPDRLRLEAVYAAPFHNERSTGPSDGMEKSYEEIERVLGRMGRATEGFVFKGARAWLDTEKPARTPAVDDLIARARTATPAEPLYVAAIGAITNVATAITLAPDIISRIVVVWLGGQPTTWHTASEFNLKQDMAASRLMFDSGVPLVFVPCTNVAEHLRTTQAEIERFVQGHGPIGNYLSEIYAAHFPDHYARSKVIWDLAPLAWLVHAGWSQSALVASPILTTEITWSHDPRRPFIRELIKVSRDAIFADLFRKIEKAAAQ